MLPTASPDSAQVADDPHGQVMALCASGAVMLVLLAVGFSWVLGAYGAAPGALDADAEGGSSEAGASAAKTGDASGTDGGAGSGGGGVNPLGSGEGAGDGGSDAGGGDGGGGDGGGGDGGPGGQGGDGGGEDYCESTEINEENPDESCVDLGSLGQGDDPFGPAEEASQDADNETGGAISGGLDEVENATQPQDPTAGDGNVTIPLDSGSESTDDPVEPLDPVLEPLPGEPDEEEAPLDEPVIPPEEPEVPDPDPTTLL